MKHVLSAAGRAFLRTFAAALIVYATGLSQAQNFNELLALGVAALLASGAAGLRAVQAYVPSISFAKWLPIPAGAIADSFAHGFLAAFIVSLSGAMNTPDLSTWHSAIVGVVVGALNAGIRAIQGILTVDEPPRGRGIPNPEND
jgi:hypothetical protein